MEEASVAARPLVPQCCSGGWALTLAPCSLSSLSLPQGRMSALQNNQTATQEATKWTIANPLFVLQRILRIKIGTHSSLLFWLAGFWSLAEIEWGMGSGHRRGIGCP